MGKGGLIDRKEYADPFKIYHMFGEKIPDYDHKKPKENEQKFGWHGGCLCDTEVLAVSDLKFSLDVSFENMRVKGEGCWSSTAGC